MNFARRVTLTLVVVALLSAAAYGVGWAIKPASDPIAFGAPRTGSTVSPDASTSPSPDDASSPTEPAEPTEPTEPSSPADPVSPEPKPQPAPEPDPEPVAGPRLMGPGDDNDEVRELQARLRQIEWFNQDVTGLYGDVTTEAVRGFQAKRGTAVTGEVDQTTLDRLLAMTTEPTDAELANELADGGGENTPGALDPRCLEAEALCIDKSTSTLRWVVDGTVQTTLDVRFGSEYTPTREGLFSVESKSPDHVSSIYGSAMPFAMFFSGGQAVHYSSDFAAVGYAGASHGCVNVRDYDALAALFDQVDVGDRVVVYRS